MTAGFRQSSPKYECGKDIRQWRDVAGFASSEFKRYPEPVSRLRQAACDGRWVSYYYRHRWKFREKWRADSPSTFTRKGKNSSKLGTIQKFEAENIRSKCLWNYLILNFLV